MSGMQSVAVKEDPERHRYVVDVDGVEAGMAVYHLRGGRHFFVHTEVDASYSGRGVGTRLIQEALEDVRARGGVIVPLCPFVARHIETHREFDEIIDWEMLKRIESGKGT